MKNNHIIIFGIMISLQTTTNAMGIYYVIQMLTADIQDLRTRINKWQQMDDTQFTLEVRKATNLELQVMSDEAKAHGKMVYIDQWQKILAKKEARLKLYSE